MPPTSARRELLPGTLEMLILRTLTLGALHGYAIGRHLSQQSEGVLEVEQGSLYPALERLLAKGWVTAKWSLSPTGRNARYYTITASGRRQLGSVVESYDRMTLAIARVLGRK